MLDLDAKERRWEIDARDPANHYLVGLLNDYRAEWAIIRQWAGYDQAVAMREEEITRLSGLLRQAMWKLRETGADAEAIAQWIERSLGRR